MKLGILLGTGGGGYQIDLERVKEAENLGYDSIWTSEAWGADAISPAAWVLANTSRIKVGTAIMQMSARTPAMTAMTVMTLQQLSNNRFILGIGPSGPQVIEGWHGQPFGKPLMRTKEYVSIIRKILAREQPLTHEGEHYQIPYNGPGATGLGKPLKSILHGNPEQKIYTASFSPRGMTMSAEVADGVFPIFMNPERFDVFEPYITKGFEKAGGGKSLENYDIAPFCRISMDVDLDKARLPIKENLALYIGGMGAREKNFYNDFAKRIGYEEEAVKIQDLFLGGKKAEAVAAVPDSLVDEVSLVGPKERIVERLEAWKAAAKARHVDSLLLASTDIAAMRVVAEAVL